MKTFDIPLKPLTEETIKGLGTIFHTFSEAEIELVRWRTAGSRPVDVGGYGGVVTGSFEVYWRGQIAYYRNEAVGHGQALGWAVDPTVASKDVEMTERPFILADLVNYHDDGGQAFIGTDGGGSVYLLAPPGDNITPDDFVALYCNGRLGINLHPGVWHLGPVPLSQRGVYDNKQGGIHATVEIYAQQEFGGLFKVPLRKP